MNERTKELRKIMSDNALKSKHVAVMLGRSLKTVQMWRCRKSIRVIPAPMLSLLRHEVAQRDKAAA